MFNIILSIINNKDILVNFEIVSNFLYLSISNIKIENIDD